MQQACSRSTSSFWYQGAQHTAGRGRVFVINSGEPHTGDPVLSDGYLYRALYPHLHYLEKVLRDVGAHPGPVVFKGAVLDDDLLSSLLAKFHMCILEHAPAAECESALLSALARLLARHADPQAVTRSVGQERPAVKLAKDFIESHFSEDISISRLARLSSLSAFYFARAFERETGLPPHAYLESVRIRKVRGLLDQGQTLVSAALSAGFADQSHLTHRFKRILGITPGQCVRERKIQQAQ